MTLEEALNVYQALAKSLSWPEYFRLLKSLLFKLTRISAKAALTQGDNFTDEDL